MGVTRSGPVRTNVTRWNGVPPNNLVSGRVPVNAQDVTDKTGYALTAGSYSFRASSCQRSTVTVSGSSTAENIAISAITTTRAFQMGSQRGTGNGDDQLSYIMCTHQITGTGAVTCTRGSTGTGRFSIADTEVKETF